MECMVTGIENRNCSFLRELDAVVDQLLVELAPLETQLTPSETKFKLPDWFLRIKGKFSPVLPETEYTGAVSISEIEYTDIVELSRDLNKSPADVGLFMDLHQRCSEILRYQGTNKLPEDDCYSLAHTSFSSRLELAYKEKFPYDVLLITYSKGLQPEKSLALARIRGYHDTKRLAQNEPPETYSIVWQTMEASVRSAGGYPDLNENPTHFFAHRPRSLIFFNEGEYKVHKYKAF